jgi:hypothetical protein
MPAIQHCAALKTKFCFVGGWQSNSGFNSSARHGDCCQSFVMLQHLTHLPAHVKEALFPSRYNNR